MSDRGVRKEIEKSWTLPSEFYTDAGLFDRTREDLFAKSWQFVGDLSGAKAPGHVHPFTLLPGFLDEPLVLTRGMDDKLNLVSNVCTHRGMVVCEGDSNERFLRCRYHGRRFGLDGKFQAMPGFEGVCDFPSESDHLPQIPMGTWGPLLFASLNPNISFEDFLAPVRKRLGWLPIGDFVHSAEHSREYTVRAHWALYVDNYLEGFHIPFIHAALTQALDYDSYVYDLFGHGNLQYAEAQDGEDCFDLPPNSPDHGRRIAAYYYWMLPNTMFNFYPWGLSMNVVAPISPSLTKVSFLRYVWKENLMGRGAGGDLDRVEREDEAVVEQVQRGVRSRFYDRGRFSAKQEVGTHHFHNLAANAMGLK